MTDKPADDSDLETKMAWAESVLARPRLSEAVTIDQLRDEVRDRYLAYKFMLLQPGLSDDSRHLIHVGMDWYQRQEQELTSLEAEQRRQAERQADSEAVQAFREATLAQSRALTRATWTLVVVTGALLVATLVAAFIARSS